MQPQQPQQPQQATTSHLWRKDSIHFQTYEPLITTQQPHQSYSLSSQASAMALAAYRHLLRSVHLAFKGTPSTIFPRLQQLCASRSHTNTTNSPGDSLRLPAALGAAREGFEANRHLSAHSKEASNQIAHAEDVAKILRENVVQGQALDEGGSRYST